MKQIHILLSVAALAVSVGGAMTVSAAGADADKSSMIFGGTLPPGYRDWKLISVAHEEGSLNDLRAVLDLIARYRERRSKVTAGDQFAKARRACDVGAFADIHERDRRRERKRLQSRKPQQRLRAGNSARRFAGDGGGDGAEMIGSRAAATPDNVDQSGVGELAD